MITEKNNFCRVFELPNTYPQAFCFGDGHPVTFQLVDWFQPIPTGDILSDTIKPWGEYVYSLTVFLKNKDYMKVGKQYLLITDFGESMLFNKV